MQQDLLDFVYDVIIADPVLQAEFHNNSVDIRYTWQNDEEVFPYITHFFRLRPVGPWGLVQARWTINVWDYGPDGARALRIHRRLKTLFDKLYYQQVENISCLRFFLEGESTDVEKEDRIWHNVLMFGVRYADNEHIESICTRDNPMLS